jgi:pantothenate synthetase
VDAKSLQPIADASLQPTLLAVAALFPSKDLQGTVRLIDNIVIGDQIASQ